MKQMTIDKTTQESRHCSFACALAHSFPFALKYGHHDAKLIRSLHETRENL